MRVKLLTEHYFESLSLKGCCTSSSEFTYVKTPHCWKSHAMAHLCHKKGSGTLTTKRIEKYQEQNFRVILQILTCDSSKSLLVNPKYVVSNCMQSSNNQSEYELIKNILYTE